MCNECMIKGDGQYNCGYGALLSYSGGEDDSSC